MSFFFLAHPVYDGAKFAAKDVYHFHIEMDIKTNISLKF